MPATVETRPVRPNSLRRLAAAGVVALMASGCLSRSPLTTGSIDASAPADTARRDVGRLAARYEKNQDDVGVAMAYAQALRATDQGAQAAAVLQQTALRNPKNPAVLAAYGKSLAEIGRFAEAAEVLRNAHSPANPDWRVLSAQGAVADQMGDHALAQRYYEAALKIVPGEPAVMSNLGLSYALAKRLPEAESTLRQASNDPRADGRVRQNLALVLGLQGRFGEAEQVLTRDLGPAEAAQNVTALRAFVSQPNAWKAIRSAEKTGEKARPARVAASGM
ncbi:tetratricopeptide repeat protein [Methylobacterium nonmethylotrophicum]|uniref:Tetratricopeptide repeat protein n=1 Tax=Methylobacterium nonmethylotrophicum TaxID=1141884 RepID=A0A4Z0NT87_9HYPH|nr:tetratricopeptide repeat protein [Methylobacterium nonmethylotrophicum]TGD99859.1 tetratricopeptide repeat protein [Methylobacterium nonmethylotrophicum]